MVLVETYTVRDEHGSIWSEITICQGLVVLSRAIPGIQSLRKIRQWNPVTLHTFLDRLSRHERKKYVGSC